MSSYDFFWDLGDIILLILSPLDLVGNLLNYAIIAVGFVGLFYWLNMQNNFNKAAEANPEIRK